MIICQSKKNNAKTDLEVKWSLEPFDQMNDSIDACFYQNNFYLEQISVIQNPKESRSLFGEISDSNGLLGFVYAQELTFSRAQMIDFIKKVSLDKKSLKMVIHPFVNFTINQALPRNDFKVFVLGNCQVSGNYGLKLYNLNSGFSDSQLYELIIQSAEITFNTYHAVLIKDIPMSKGSKEFQLIEKSGFYEIPSFPVMQMKISPVWKNEDDYIQSFSSKYRIRYNASRKKNGPVKKVNLDLSGIKEELDKIYSLYLSVFNEADFKLHKVPATYFVLLKEVFKDSCIFSGYYLGEELIGFSTFLVNEVQSDAHLMGLNYAYNKEYSLYQNMLYDFVLMGIEFGTKCIDLGRTAMEIKSTVGAIPVDYAMYVKMKSPIFRRMLSRLDSNTFDRAWVPRNPFKLVESE